MDLRTLGSVLYTTIRPLLPTAWVEHWNAGGFKLTNLGEPTSVNDAARKNEVDIVGFAAADAAADATSALASAATATSTANTALARALPSGGTTGQVLAKSSATSYDAGWVAVGDVPSTRLVSAGSGLTGGGSLAADRTIAVDFGTGAAQVRPGNDATYTDARTPTAHATSHQNGGGDEISVTGLSGLLGDPQRSDTLVSSSGDKSIGALTDGQMLVVSGSTVTTAAIPTGDITGVTAGAGLSGGGTSGTVTVSANIGTSSGTVAAGDDSRFTDDRTASELRSATTVVAVSTATAPTSGQVLTATSSTAATWQTPSVGDITAVTAGTGLSGGGSTGDVSLAVVYGSTASTATEGNDARLSNARTPTAHATSHQNGGGDELSVAGLSGVLADAQRADVIAATGGDLTVGAITDGQMLVRSGTTVVSAAIPAGDITEVAAGTGLTGGGTSGSVSLAVSYGTSGTTACVGNDARLSDDRTASGIRSATTVVAVSSATAPAAGQVLTATSSTAAQWSDPAGDITAVTAGSGITGGGTTGAVSVAADFGTGAGKVTEGNDSRLSDDRTASGIRSATTVVSVSAATAPTSGQVLTATSGTAATWQTPSGGGGAATQIEESGGPTTLTIGSIADGELIRRSGTTAVGIAQSALSLAGSQISSGTVPLARMTAATASQNLRVNAAGTAIEGYTPINAWVTSDVAITTTPELVLTINLPLAGTYRVSGTLLAQAGTISSTTKLLSFVFAHASVTGCQIGWAYGPTIATAGGYGYGTDFTTALPAMVFGTSQSNTYSSVSFWGEITISASGDLTISGEMSGQTATVKPGCYIRLERA